MIEVDGRKYVEISYLEMANNNARRLAQTVKDLRESIRQKVANEEAAKRREGEK